MSVYQVWHDPAFPSSCIRQAMGLEPERVFPDDFMHVANVEAESLEEVWELVSDKGNMVDGADKWECWEENAAVEVLVMPWRSTSAGDVIVTPDGEAYRVQTGGFDYEEASQGKYRLHDILRVMIRARKKLSTALQDGLQPPDIFDPVFGDIT
jgi:hypothetical protein